MRFPFPIFGVVAGLAVGLWHVAGTWCSSGLAIAGNLGELAGAMIACGL